MSRSRKKNPYGSITCCGCRPGVEKSYKQHAHRQLRRAVRVSLRVTEDDEHLPDDKLFGNPWCGPKDGKWRWHGPAAYRK